MNHLLAPSLLAADFSKMESVIEIINQSEADWLHLDIMDGVFVPNISFGLPILKSLRPHVNKLFDVHLMIVQPDKYISDFKKAGADLLNVHYEACTHLSRTIQAIKAEGMKAGCTIILKNIDDFAAFNKIYEEYFPNKPARTTFAASGLAVNASIEIDVIASK